MHSAKVPVRVRAPVVGSDGVGSGRIIVLVLGVFPQHVAPAGRTIEKATQDEQQVGESVQITAGAFGNRLVMPQMHHGTFGPAADGTGQVGNGGGAGAARQDEFLEGGQGGVEFRHPVFHRLQMGVLDEGSSRNTDLPAQVEEVVLHRQQGRAYRCIHRVRKGFGQQQANGGVEFVDFPQGVDAGAVLAHPGAISQAGGAAISGAGDDFGKSVAHGLLVSWFGGRYRLVVGMALPWGIAGYRVGVGGFYPYLYPGTSWEPREGIPPAMSPPTRLVVSRYPGLRFAANLSFLFTELPFLERFGAAAEAGFSGVEYLFPYAHPAAHIVAALEAQGLTQVLFNLPAGDWEGGERGLAAVPGREAEFMMGVDLGLEYALALGCSRVNALAGIPPSDAPPGEIRRVFADNLRRAARRLAPHGITLCVEPINSRVDMPGFWLDRPREAFALVAELGEPNLRVQYDLYHAQIMEGDLARTLTGQLARIGHLQIADNPGRGAPGTGEIHFPFLFAHLTALGYDGWIGCEYRPQGHDAWDWLFAPAPTAGEG